MPIGPSAKNRISYRTSDQEKNYSEINICIALVSVTLTQMAYRAWTMFRSHYLAYRKIRLIIVIQKRRRNQTEYYFIALNNFVYQRIMFNAQR